VTHISRLTLPAIVVLSLAAGARPEFEVASIKPNTSGDRGSSTRPGPTELFLENASLRKCIALAYNVSEDRDNAISAPDWLNFERYDIAAKYPAGTPLDQVRVMLQNLLADRLSGAVFQLGRPVLDRTGISGLYDFTLGWMPDDAAPSLFTALQEQLGLRLDAQKGSVEVLVIDSMERKPTLN
jgi:hypothetical protein